MTPTELKQQIADVLSLNWITYRVNNAKPMVDLLRDCLKHIEELEEKIHKLESAKVWTRLDQLQSQLREREADCAAMREALDSVWDIEEMGYTVNDPEGESGHSTCNKCEAQLPHGGHAENCPQPIIEKALSTTAGRELLERLQAVEAERVNRPEIVCICGSSRFCDLAAVHAWNFEKMGKLALSMHLLPDWYWQATNKVGHDHGAEQEGVAHVLDELHLRKIDLCDFVFVINKGGYIGERTRIEIDYAKFKGKRIEYLEALQKDVQ